ncbi:hypothetical protein OIU77_022128 [Salix suchowensis]|uniref:Reverse transcriptase zinc-binding domain-containing protein n=1 Tax=Salix suchowensis TaxID=1278906 RepID=A0ABQ8ZGV1_9ROSI|nr:hypothetical protein OIU77_022128 [Salix suchowensis]
MDRPHVLKNISANTCVLCGVLPETHSHLFFECVYSSKIWSNISGKSNFHSPTMQWDLFLQWASANFGQRNNFSHLLARHAISTTVYFIWQERNHRVFKNQAKTVDSLTKDAIITMRSLLLNYRNAIPDAVKRDWNL